MLGTQPYTDTHSFTHTILRLMYLHILINLGSYTHIYLLTLTLTQTFMFTHSNMYSHTFTHKPGRCAQWSKPAIFNLFHLITHVN